MRISEQRVIFLIRKTTVVVLATLVMVALMSTSIYNAFIFAEDGDAQVTTEAQEATDAKASSSADSKDKASSKKPAETAEALNSLDVGSAIVYSSSTSQQVYALHANRKLQPGNITKLMTAIIVIENMHSDKELKSRIEITAEAKAKDKALPDAGKTMKLSDLLEHMLLTGSDAAAELLADYSASTVDIFVSEMNSKALEYGLLNTQFTNVTGAYSEEQYSTAYDCAVISQRALRYERIKNILKGTDNDIKYDNLVGCIQGKLSSDDNKLQYLGIASHKDMDIVVVMLDANEKVKTEAATRLFDYGFDNVSMNTIVKAGKKVGKVRIRHGASTLVNAYTSAKGYAYIPPEGSSDLVKTQVVMSSDLKAPLKAGSKVGEYQIFVADELKGTVDLVIDKDVEKGWLPSYLYISNLAVVIIGVVLVLIMLLVLRIAQLRRRNRRRKERLKKAKIEAILQRERELEEDRRRRNWTYH